MEKKQNTIKITPTQDLNMNIQMEKEMEKVQNIMEIIN